MKGKALDISIPTESMATDMLLDTPVMSDRSGKAIVKANTITNNISMGTANVLRSIGILAIIYHPTQ